MLQVSGVIEQSAHFLATPDQGQLAAQLGLGHLAVKPRLLQCAGIKEAQRRQPTLYRLPAQLALLDQVELIAANVFGSKPIRRLMEVAGEIADREQVGTDRCR